MNFLDVIAQARVFLRDPDALIWDSEMLGLYWNETSTEIAQKVGLLSRARTLRYPSQSSITYIHSWEYASTMGNRISTIQPFKTFHQYEGGIVVLYPWESAYNADSQNAEDSNYRVTQWWESYHGSSSEPPRVILNESFEAIRYAAFDEYTITQKDEREIMFGDTGYKTTQGRAQYYYFPDSFHREMVLYPVPNIVFDEDKIYPSSGLLDKNRSLYTGYAFTHLWEPLYATAVDRILLQTGDFLLLQDGTHLIGETYDDQIIHNYDITHLYSYETERYNYLFDWEYDTLMDKPPTEDTNTYIFMYYFEYPTTTKEIPGYVTGTSDEIVTGVDDEFDTDGQLFIIYDYIPPNLEDYADDLNDWPVFMLKTVMAGMLERCYSADTDGFIPSLRDYWKMRKEIGIRAIKQFKQLRSRDRDYRLGTREDRVESRHPRLPHTYPAFYP